MSEIKALLEKIDESQLICDEILRRQVKFAETCEHNLHENKKLLRGIYEVACLDESRSGLISHKENH